MELQPEFIDNKKKSLCDGIKRIRKKETPFARNYRTFGRFSINVMLLTNENIVLIKYPKSQGNVLGFKRKLVSNELKDLLLDMCNNGILNTQLLKYVENTDEIEYLELLLKKCMLTTQIDYKRHINSIDDFVEKFTTLKQKIIITDDDAETSLKINTQLISKLKPLISLLSNPTINKISVEDAEFLNSCLEQLL